MGARWGIISCGLIATLLTATPAVSEDEKTGTLIVAATGFESEDGHVLVQLANSKEDYEADDEGFRVARIKAADGKATTKFEGLPYGEYAIKIFHDENDNEELDIGWMGPEERYGFSNDARAMMGPPDWDDAKLVVDQPEQSITIKVE